MKLLSIDGNAKIAKTNLAQGLHEIYAGLSMMPDPIICPGSKAAGCMDGCLKSAGRGAFSNVAKARQAKTDWWHADWEGFVAALVKDLEALVRKANKLGKQAVVRLNVLSDIAWETVPCERHGETFRGIPEAFPEIQFYDYTKRAARLHAILPKNYHLTFSYSGVATYAWQVASAQAADANMAVVFHVKKGQPLPKLWQGKAVIDGDEHDARIHDPKGIIVGLRAKGKARADDTGFVVAV